MDDALGYQATPLQYLERLSISNAHLGDDVRYEGVVYGPKNQLRILTSQAHVAGSEPTAEELHAWLIGRGWREDEGIRFGDYDASTWVKGTVWMFDVRPANILKVADSNPIELVPIDIIVQRRRRA